MTAASPEIIAQVRAEYGPRVLLGFSRGKDSLAAWLRLREHFDQVIPFHLFTIPKLPIVEESLAYYERVMGCRIWRMPQPGFYRWLRNFTFQTPPRAAVLAAANLPTFGYRDVVDAIARAEGIPPDQTMTATGVRSADSPRRRQVITICGAIDRTQPKFYPVWDWSTDQCIDIINKSGVELPIDYALFGRTIDGLDYRVVSQLKKHRPQDYAKFLEWFPLLEMEVWRYEKGMIPRVAA